MTIYKILKLLTIPDIIALIHINMLLSYNYNEMKKEKKIESHFTVRQSE